MFEMSHNKLSFRTVTVQSNTIKYSLKSSKSMQHQQSCWDRESIW